MPREPCATLDTVSVLLFLYPSPWRSPPGWQRCETARSNAWDRRGQLFTRDCRAAAGYRVQPLQEQREGQCGTASCPSQFGDTFGSVICKKMVIVNMSISYLFWFLGWESIFSVSKFSLNFPTDLPRVHIFYFSTLMQCLIETQSSR